ncbi:MAG TPA: plastocyanin/azurin family copper-binding protein [Symbiobacteriaceae bacterium]|nr:plastocyanin/azurin family copper-binding protein [Symbiobacteriaceae bacterium]
MRKRFIHILLGALLLAGCGSTKAPAATGEGTVIKLSDMQFHPSELTVKVGTTVTFTNEESMVHDVNQLTVKEVGKTKPGFDSGPISPGKSWSYRFDQPGTYPILCTQGLHYTAGMVGTIIVTK